MNPARDRRSLAYIHEAIRLVEQRTRQGREAFLQDVDTQDAVLWRLETLAGATNRLSDTIEGRHPEIRWRAIHSEYRQP